MTDAKYIGLNVHRSPQLPGALGRLLSSDIASAGNEKLYKTDFSITSLMKPAALDGPQWRYEPKCPAYS
jgi:hypothetical protein